MARKLVQLPSRWSNSSTPWASAISTDVPAPSPQVIGRNSIIGSPGEEGAPSTGAGARQSPGDMPKVSIGAQPAMPSGQRRTGAQWRGVSGVHGLPAGRHRLRGSSTASTPAHSTIAA